MKFARLTAALAALLFVSAAGAVENANPFRASGNMHVISVSNVASAAEQLAAFSSDATCTQYLLTNTGSVDAWVVLAATSAGASAVTIPSAGSPANSILVRAGTTKTVAGPNQAYITTKTASSTTTLNATCGQGNTEAHTSVVTTSPPTGTSATQVQGTSAAGAAISGNPLPPGVYDGTNVQYLRQSSPTNASLNGVGLLAAGATLWNGNNDFRSWQAVVNATDGSSGVSIGWTGHALFNGSSWDRQRAITGASAAAGTGVTAVAYAPTSSANAGLAQVASTAAESNHVLKGSAGNLYSITITTGASAGFLMIFNATSAPVDGAVTPVYCVPVAANSGTPLRWDVPAYYSTGVTAVFSTGASCVAKTASATAFFYAQVQ